jgi:hypothetical protein
VRARDLQFPVGEAQKKAQPVRVALEVPPKEEDFGGVRRHLGGVNATAFWQFLGRNASVCCCFAIQLVFRKKFIINKTINQLVKSSYDQNRDLGMSENLARLAA